MVIKYKKLAIVVPVYNVENYAEDLIKSVLGQSFSDFLLILVDDGSNDNSLKILKKYSRKDDRIVVLSKKNGGPGSEINEGLNYIQKNKFCFEYIWFCDADDKADPDALTKVIEALDRQDADYGLISVKRFDKVNIQCYPASIKKETVLNNNDIACQYFRLGMKWRKEPCSEAFLNNKFFRYQLVEDLRFREDIKRAEDFDFFIRILPRLKKGILLPDVYFWYRMRKSSLTNSYKETGDLIVCQSYYETLRNRSIIEQKAIQHKLLRAYYLDICSAIEKGEQKRYEKLIKKIQNSKIRYSITFSDLKIIFLLKYMRFFLPLFVKFRAATKRKKDQRHYFD